MASPARLLGIVACLLAAVVAAAHGGGLPHALAEESEDDAMAAFVAALRTVNGVPEPDCSVDDPQQRPCVSPLAGSAPERGVAAFSIRNADGLGGGVLVMGRTPEGEWRYWLGGQQYYQRVTLPGAMVVCADGAGANLRAAPSTNAEVLSVLPDLSVVEAEQFVLTEPGSRSLDRPGAGWYRLAAPSEGWVFSTLLAIDSPAGCALRDVLVGR